MALSVIAAIGFIRHPWRCASEEQLMPLFAIDPVYGAAGRSFLKRLLIPILFRCFGQIAKQNLSDIKCRRHCWLLAAG